MKKIIGIIILGIIFTFGLFANPLAKALEEGEWVEVEINVAGKLSNRGIDAMKFTQNYGTTGDSWKADQPADEAPWLIDSIKYVLA